MPNQGTTNFPQPEYYQSHQADNAQWQQQQYHGEVLDLMGSEDCTFPDFRCPHDMQVDGVKRNARYETDTTDDSSTDEASDDNAGDNLKEVKDHKKKKDDFGVELVSQEVFELKL